MRGGEKSARAFTIFDNLVWPSATSFISLPPLPDRLGRSALPHFPVSPLLAPPCGRPGLAAHFFRKAPACVLPGGFALGCSAGAKSGLPLIVTAQGKTILTALLSRTRRRRH